MDPQPYNWRDDADPTVETPVRQVVHDTTAVIDVEVVQDDVEVVQDDVEVVQDDVEVVQRWPAPADRVLRYAPLGWHRTRKAVHHYRTTPGPRTQPEDEAWEMWKRRKVTWAVAGAALVALWLLLGAVGWPAGFFWCWGITVVLVGALVVQGIREERSPLVHEVVHHAPSAPPEHHPDSTTAPPTGAPPAPPERTTAPVHRTTEVVHMEPDGAPLHQWAADLQTGLRAYNLIGKNDKIQASRPMEMRVGERSANGVSFTVTLPLTCPASHVVAKLHEMAAVFDTTDDRLILLPAGGSNRLLWVWKCDRHPLGGAGTWSPLQDAEEINVWEGWQFGWTITGEPVTISPVGDRMIFAGSPGSGKSVSAGLLPLGYALDPTTRSILMDPEGFGTWTPYEKVAEVIQGSDPATLRRMADRLLWVVQVEMVNRQAEINRVREEEPMLLDTDAVNERASRDPRYKLAPLLIVVEEAASLTNAADKRTREDAIWALSEIARRCRKYGITLALISQKCTTDNVPSAITAMMTSQYLAACLTNSMCDSVIPDWRDLGMNPRKALQVDDGRGGGTPGGGYFKGRALVEPKGVPWVLMRTDYVTSANVRAMIDRARALRLDQRPELLPASDDGPAMSASSSDLAPAPQSAPQPVETPSLDLQPLIDVVRVLEPNGDMAAPAIVEELAYINPDRYAEISQTRAGLDALMDPFELPSRQVRVAGRKPYGLRHVWAAARLRQLGGTPEAEAEAPDAPEASKAQVKGPIERLPLMPPPEGGFS